MGYICKHHLISSILGLPIDGVPSSTNMLPCLSVDCRKALYSVIRSEHVQMHCGSSGETECSPPLPEDWLLRGLPLLSSLHEKIDFNLGNLDIRIEEVLSLLYSQFLLMLAFVELWIVESYHS